jgi:hypothetical protein
MAAGEGLELGLLVRGDHVVVGAERDAVEDARVQVENPSCFRTEVGVAGEDPRPVAPRLDRVGVQPAAHRRRRDRLDETLCQRLDPGHHLGSEDPGPTRSGTVLQSDETLFEEALPPSRRDVDAHPDLLGDVHVLSAVGSKQHDPSTDNLGVRRSARRRPLLKDGPVNVTQLDLERRTARHQPTSAPGRPHGNCPEQQLHSCTYRRDHQH